MLPEIRKICDFLREEAWLCRLEWAGEKKRSKEARKSLTREGKGLNRQPPACAATQRSRGTFQHRLGAERMHPDQDTERFENHEELCYQS